MIISFNTEMCVGCGACAVACMEQNDIHPDLGEEPFRRIFVVDTEHELQGVTVGCMHCEDALCLKSCPVGCIYRDEETGMVLVDNSLCIGCHSCSMACPFGIPSFYDGKMVKCDGCNERIKAGLKPACIKACPFGVLSLCSNESFNYKKKEETVKKYQRKN